MTTVSYPSVNLTSRMEWYDWSTYFRHCANSHGVLRYIDPDQPKQTLEEAVNPLDNPMVTQYTNDVLKLHHDRYVPLLQASSQWMRL